MPLPAPNLDDRRFQELVDDAKRMVQQRCPEWTDHNVSDPGVTLIELMAWMTDQLVYRLNRVPDRNYVRFLELLGVQLFPATAARVPLTFWLAAPTDQVVVVPADTRASTTGDGDDVVVFRTTSRLEIPPVQLRSVLVEHDGQTYDEGDVLKGGIGFDAFQDPPVPGDAVLFGLDRPAPSCALRLEVDCRVEGVGIDPERAPLVWESFDGSDWLECELQSDSTGGLNQQGEVVVHLPASQEMARFEGISAAWVRCRATPPQAGAPFYRASPEITDLDVVTIGGTAPADQSDEIVDEVLGTSEGAPGQALELQHRPVLAEDRPLVVEVASDDGWQQWEQVEDFALAGAGDRVFQLDEVAGQVRFGPMVRLADGGVRHHGAVPVKGAAIRVPRYRTGGGRRGNVSEATIVQLLSTIPVVDRVENRQPARGGVDVESMDNARVRGPMGLRTRQRAVTREDYEHLALQAAPEVARVHAVATDDTGVRVLVVPNVDPDPTVLPFADLQPSDHSLARIRDHLDERRTIGARVLVEPPLYHGMTVRAEVRPERTANRRRVERDAKVALARHFHPTLGGPDGSGWQFGRPVLAGEVHAVLQAVAGAQLIEYVGVFNANPITSELGDEVERLELGETALPFAFDHGVLVLDPL